MRTALFLLFLAAGAGAQTPATAFLSGRIQPDPAWSDWVYLVKQPGYTDFFNGFNELVIDSVRLAPDGSFKFDKRTYLGNPALYRLNLPPKGSSNGATVLIGLPEENFVHLVLHRNSQIVLEANAARLTTSARLLRADRENQSLQVIQQLRLPTQETVGYIAEATAVYRKTGQNIPDSLKYPLMMKYRQALVELQPALEQFMDTVASVHAGLLATCYYNFDNQLSAYAPMFERLYTRWETAAPDNTYLRNFGEMLDEFKYFLPLGSPAPEIALPTPQSDTLRLSQIKGKLILLDFWASWCGPCREENRVHVAPLYQAYHSRGFEVLGISFDTNKKNWAAAIEKDRYPWLHVSDLLGLSHSPLAGQFRIKGIPTTYLLDSNGLVLAKNLRGEQLRDFIRSYMEN